MALTNQCQTVKKLFFTEKEKEGKENLGKVLVSTEKRKMTIAVSDALHSKKNGLFLKRKKV